MYFELSEEQQLVKANMREFCEKFVEPAAEETDHGARFPSENLKKLAEQEMLGIPYPEEYGGAGADYLTYIVTIEELSRACATTGFVVAANTSLVCFPIYQFGSEDQKKKFLTPLCRGKSVGALALSEPGTGSGTAAWGVTARHEGNEYVLNGTKSFVANGPVAEVLIVFASTQKGPSAFIVPADTHGIQAGVPINKMGVRGALFSEVVLKDCRIAEGNLLGREGQGAEMAAAVLDNGRISVAAQSLGIAQAALEESVRYSKERVQFNQPICNFQAIQWMIANMGIEVEVSRYLTYYAAWCYDRGLPYSREAAMAKLTACDTAVRQSDTAVQIHGGIGTIKGQKVERFYRDAKVAQIFEGTSEDMKTIIADSILSSELLEEGDKCLRL
jgi:butyryl-CoA dehydrogenase